MKNIQKKTLLSVATFAFVAAAIMTFAAAWGKPVGNLYWIITFSLWGLGLLTSILMVMLK